MGLNSYVFAVLACIFLIVSAEIDTTTKVNLNLVTKPIATSKSSDVPLQLLTKIAVKTNQNSTEIAHNINKRANDNFFVTKDCEYDVPFTVPGVDEFEINEQEPINLQNALLVENDETGEKIIYVIDEIENSPQQINIGENMVAGPLPYVVGQQPINFDFIKRMPPLPIFNKPIFKYQNPMIYYNVPYDMPASVKNPAFPPVHPIVSPPVPVYIPERVETLLPANYYYNQVHKNGMVTNYLGWGGIDEKRDGKPAVVVKESNKIIPVPAYLLNRLASLNDVRAQKEEMFRQHYLYNNDLFKRPVVPVNNAYVQSAFPARYMYEQRAHNDRLPYTYVNIEDSKYHHNPVSNSQNKENSITINSKKYVYVPPVDKNAQIVKTNQFKHIYKQISDKSKTIVSTTKATDAAEPQTEPIEKVTLKKNPIVVLPNIRFTYSQKSNDGSFTKTSSSDGANVFVEVDDKNIGQKPRGDIP